MEWHQRAVKIVATPQGEAPLWVREAWVGLELPIWPRSGHATWRSYGVLSQPRTGLAAIWGNLFNRKWTTGYLVPSAEAIRRLEAGNPEAAAWWRANTDRADSEQTGFIFDAPACRPIG